MGGEKGMSPLSNILTSICRDIPSVRAACSVVSSCSVALIVTLFPSESSMAVC